MKKGDDVIVAIRLTNKATGKPVPDAVIFKTRVDMAPDNMAEMESPVAPLPAQEPGVYAFKTDLPMAGRYQITLSAKVQGEPETVTGKVIVKAIEVSRRGAATAALPHAHSHASAPLWRARWCITMTKRCAFSRYSRSGPPPAGRRWIDWSDRDAWRPTRSAALPSDRRSTTAIRRRAALVGGPEDGRSARPQLSARLRRRGVACASRRSRSRRRSRRAISCTTAIRWGCRTPRRCRRRTRWGWTTSRSTKATTPTTARSSSRPARSSAAGVKSEPVAAPHDPRVTSRRPARSSSTNAGCP